MLTRYACYLIAQNGDPRKETIAFAQSYFEEDIKKLKRRVKTQENQLIKDANKLPQEKNQK